jgi:PAS domain S-box-containing protein
MYLRVLRTCKYIKFGVLLPTSEQYPIMNLDFENRLIGEPIYQTLIRTSSEAILFETLDGKIIDCNEAACRIYGYSHDELCNLKITDLLPADVKKQLPAFITQAETNGSFAIQSRNIRKNGEVFPVDVNTHTLTTSEGRMVVAHVRDITEIEKSSQVLERHMQELIAIYNTSLEIMTETDLATLLHEIVKRAVNLVDAPMGSLYLVEPGQQVLILVVSYRLPKDYTGTVLQMGEGLSGRIAQTGEMIIVEDYQAWAGKAQVFSKTAFKYVVGVPLKIDDQVIGVINITDTRDRPPYSEQQIQLINLFANQAAVAIHKAQLLEATRNALAAQQETEKIQSALYRISEATQTAEDISALFGQIHQVVAELMPARNFYIALYDSVTEMISYPYYADEYDSPPMTAKPVRGLTEYVLRKGQAVLVTPTVYQDLQSSGQVDAIGAQPVDWMGVPLVIQKQQIGMMAVQTYSAQERYTQNDRDVLAFVSSQVAMAIERKRTDEALRQSADRYRLLFENAPVGFLLINPMGSILEVNAATLGILGSPSIEATKAINVLNFSPIVEVGFAANVKRCFAEGSTITAEADYTSKWGRKIHIHYYLSPVKDEKERVILVQAILEDITNRQQAEQEIQRLNTDLRQLYQTAVEAGDRRTTLHWLSQEIIRASLNPEHVYQAIYQAVLKLMPADVFVISLLDQADDHISPVYCIENGQRFNGPKLRRDEGLSGYIINSGKSFISSNANLKDTGYIPVHFGSASQVHSFVAVPMRLGGQVLGMLSAQCYHQHDYTTEDANLLEILAATAAIALQNSEIFNQMQVTNQELVKAYEATIEGWSRALEMRDKETKGHSDRVTYTTLRFATKLGFTEKELDHLRRGVVLHDIGKMAVPDHILLKPSTLTEDEWQVMRQHPLYAYRMLSGIPFLEPALEIPYCHHENWDGTGYPRGLKGEEIPLGARIFALVDVWDALSADRPYRLGWAHSAARTYILQQAGARFDPALVQKFIELLDQGEFDKHPA